MKKYGIARNDDVGLFHRVMRRVGATWPASWLLVRVLHHLDRASFRLTGGRHTFTSLATGLPVIMLKTTGARSGAIRTVPVLGFADGDGMVMIADNHGQSRHPAWYHNLRANPEAEITVGEMTRGVHAREAEGEERERLWRRGVEVNPGWVAFQRRASNRRIPVIILVPAIK